MDAQGPQTKETTADGASTARHDGRSRRRIFHYVIGLLVLGAVCFFLYSMCGMVASIRFCKRWFDAEGEPMASPE